MEKENELWDDSALINAFDNAITKYKIMHRKEYRDNSTKGEKSISDNIENAPTLSDENPETTSHTDAVDQNNVDAGEANDVPPSQEAHVGFCTSEPYTHTLNGPHMQEALEGYTNSQEVVDYTQLLNQYNELEEQRQKVLHQLHQVGFWNYECSGEGSGPYVQWGTCSTQEHQNPEHQVSHPTVVSSCCPYVCPCFVTPSPSMPACVFGGASVCKEKIDSTANAFTVGPRKLSCCENDGVVKTAMEAAEKAILSMGMKASSNSNVHEEEEKGKKESLGLSEGEMTQSINSETDLTVVLNAWYSAGFYTGKYLSEQSIAKGRHG